MDLLKMLSLLAASANHIRGRLIGRMNDFEVECLEKCKMLSQERTKLKHQIEEVEAEVELLKTKCHNSINDRLSVHEINFQMDPDTKEIFELIEKPKTSSDSIFGGIGGL